MLRCIAFMCIVIGWVNFTVALRAQTFEEADDEGDTAQTFDLAELQQNEETRLSQDGDNERGDNERGEFSVRLMAERLNRQTGKYILPSCERSRMCKGSCMAEVGSFKMKVLASDNYIGRMVLCEGKTWEIEQVNKMLDEIKGAGGTVLDLGANLGSWTLPIAASGRSVVAIEASPMLNGFLQDSIKASAFEDRVSTHNFAAVQEITEKEICMGATDAELLDSPNAGGNQVNVGNRSFCKQHLNTSTLDQLYASDPRMKNVVAAKLDCEGCEAQALMGGKKFLSEAAPCILAVEVTEQYLCQVGTPIVDLRRFLEGMGYDASVITSGADGTCEGFNKKVEAGEISAGIQTFAFVKQRNFDACTSRKH